DNNTGTAGRVITWSKSDANGAFSASTSTTDASGSATIIFTTHTVAGTSAVVTATDNDSPTSKAGTSAAIVTVLAVPAAPSALTAIASGIGIVISWTDNSSNEQGFRVERAQIANGPWVLVFFATGP